MGDADHRSKCEQSKRRMENERNELAGFKTKLSVDLVYLASNL